MNFDINCDLGEGEPPSKTAALMECVTSVNIACGGHAGTVRTMERCIQMAAQGRVKVGAHPGLWDRKTFGRIHSVLNPEELELLLLHQVGGLASIATNLGMRLHHIKLHGALYHACDNDGRLAKRYLAAVARWWPAMTIYARAGGRVATLAKAYNLVVWPEGFLDRGYEDNGRLVSRDRSHAVLKSRKEVIERLRMLGKSGTVRTVTGKVIKLQPRTLCLHADSGHSLEFAKAVRRFLSSRSNAVD